MDPVDYSDKKDDAKAPPPRLGATQPPPTSPRLASDPNAKADSATSKNWRSERLNRSRSSSTMAIPTSQQDLVVWLQYGGWKYVAALAAFVIILVILIMLFSNNSNTSQNNVTNTNNAQGTIDSSFPTEIPPELNLPAQAGSAGNSELGAQYRVTGTDTEGLFLRGEPNTNNQPLKTMPEGTIVTIMGDDYNGPDRVWKYVHDDMGSPGWAAADWLTRVQP